MGTIKRHTKPYIVEGFVASAVDFGLFALFYLLLSAFEKNFQSGIPVLYAGAAIAFLWDMKTVYPCILDRIRKDVVEETACFISDDLDIAFTDKYARHRSKLLPSLLETWYYPKEWRMDRTKLVFQTREGKKIKVRVIWSEKHGQLSFWYDLMDIQNKTGESVLFKISYCKYSKVLLRIAVLSVPESYGKRQKEWLSRNISDVFRWMLSKKVLGES